MFVRIPTMIAGLLLVLAVTSVASAEEPEHLFQFFEKGQGIYIARNTSTTSSDFVSLTILTQSELECVVDARTLSAEELAKKYPALKTKIEEATVRAVRDYGTGVKLKPFIVTTDRVSSRSYPEEIGTYYRVLAAKPSYLLIETTSDPPRKVVYAMDKIKRITWTSGLGVQMQPERSAAGQE